MLAAAVMATALLAPSAASGQNVKESFTGFAINMNSGPRTATVQMKETEEGENGVGKILGATKIFIDKKNNLVLENYGIEPVRFNEIKKVK
jgi:hypothetical protein